MSRTKVIGLVGLGAMGNPIATNLAKKFKTIVFDMNPEAVKKTEEFGCIGAASIKDIYSCDCIITCLPNSKIVKSVVDAFLLNESNVNLWIDVTSGEPSISREIQTLLSQKNVGFVDVGMSGGPGLARTAEMTVMVGGVSSDVSSADEILESIANKIIKVGPPGSGHTVKCVNNALLAANLWNAYEGMDVLLKSNIDPQIAFDVINNSSGGSVCSQRVSKHVLNGKFDFGFSLGLLRKDIKIFTDICRENSTIHDIAKQYDIAAEKLGNDVDHMHSLKILKEDSE